MKNWKAMTFKEQEEVAKSYGCSLAEFSEQIKLGDAVMSEVLFEEKKDIEFIRVYSQKDGLSRLAVAALVGRKVDSLTDDERELVNFLHWEIKKVAIENGIVVEVESPEEKRTAEIFNKKR
jgi:hypothetical protein